MSMASIYANAYITIAASTSLGGNTGLFQTRQPTLRLSNMEHDGNTFDLYARESLEHVAFDYEYDALNPENARLWIGPNATVRRHFPLFTRGWAWRERLLSRRIIHFTRHELVWECLGSTSCECGAMDEFVGSQALRERRFAFGVPQDVEVRCGLMERSRKLAKHLSLSSETTSVNFSSFTERWDYALMYTIMGSAADKLFSTYDAEHYERWRDVISQFSRRNLTYESDVFPAVSGLAEVWIARHQDCGEYLAGLWKADLMRGLLWICVDQYERSDTGRPSQYRAPTWSWASVRRAINWLRASDTRDPVYHATINRAFCLPRTTSSVKSLKVTSKYPDEL